MTRARGLFGSSAAAAIALLVCALPAAGGGAAQPAAAPEEQTEAPEPRPVEIRLGLTIVDFARINNRDETYDVHGYLEMKWKDPRLARKPRAPLKHPAQVWRRLHPSRDLWVPKLSFLNSLEETK